MQGLWGPTASTNGPQPAGRAWAGRRAGGSVVNSVTGEILG